MNGVSERKNRDFLVTRKHDSNYLTTDSLCRYVENEVEHKLKTRDHVHEPTRLLSRNW